MRAILLAAVLAVLFFPVLGWIGSSIPRNLGHIAPADGIEIMVETNGTHTGIVMPLVTQEMDWHSVFPSAAQVQAPITHISVGWGESEVFTQVPTWSDLTASTAMRIAIFGGDPVMRVSHYNRPAPSENHRPVIISRAAYARMVRAISNSLAPPAADGSRTILDGVSPQDGYYEARGHYSLVNTCNSWVGDMLAEADIQMGVWTPFAGGVTKWINLPDPS